MILNVFMSNLGLPSVDLQSLQMMAYAKFMKMDIHFNYKTFKPYIGSQLPELICEKGRITDLEDYFEYLKFENSSDSNLGKLDKRYYPYDNLFKETLKPALLNTIWCDDKNYNEKTRSTYAKISSFPFNYIVPNYLRNQAINYIEKVYPIKNRRDYFEMELIDKAKEIIKLLSNDLSNSKYFNQPKPNEVDALIFGYLAIILLIDLPKLNNLQQTLKEHTNLVNYVNRILNEYFPKEIEFVNNKKDSIKLDDLKENNLETVGIKNIVIFGLIAIVSNLCYVLYVLSDKDEIDEEDDDEDE